MGENGAGKSTLIKVLAGAHQPNHGTITLNGKTLNIQSPNHAINEGIAVIYQEFNLIPALKVWENITLGREQTALGFIKRNEEKQRATQLFQRLGVNIDINATTQSLSIAQQQLVEIAKALAQEVKLIILDEPSATLTPQEVKALFRIIRELKAQNVGVIYVSHRLEEIFEITDTVMVMRDGTYVGEADTKDITRSQLIEMMVGRTLDAEFPTRNITLGPERLNVKNISNPPIVNDASFNVHAGEILALTGLVGAGRSETARLLFGADPLTTGTVTLDNKPLKLKSPRHAIHSGICLLTEDRKAQGLILNRSVLENFGLPNLSHFTTAGVINRSKEKFAFANYVQRMNIRIPNDAQLARNLSGGNQQKVVLAKWLQQNAEVIIFDEPTRGIDVGAKFEIYQLMNELAAQGKAIIMISSELPEVLGMADRILVMHAGRITGEIKDVPNTTQQHIMDFAIQ